MVRVDRAETGVTRSDACQGQIEKPQVSSDKDGRDGLWPTEPGGSSVWKRPEKAGCQLSGMSSGLHGLQLPELFGDLTAAKDPLPKEGADDSLESIRG
jgi:hypothetical protein